MDYHDIYIINIFERYTDLKKSNKQEFDNNDLWKIFEYYSCIKLSEEYKKPFYEYNDIDPDFKELNKMSRNDTGIDCSDLLNTIVQCKLRKNTLNWKECSTFFGSQVIFSAELRKPVVRWDNLIITRNTDCTLSENLLERKELFIDRPFNKQELITFCENLIINPPKYPIINNDFKLRDYQIEAIDIVKKNKKNVIINLPTGTGKNSVIIYSMNDNLKYLILVPRIILMDQLKKEIIKHKPNMKNKIQLIGDDNDTFNENKLITICVFNSIHLIKNYCLNFDKIFIDEAHHIYKPAIYYEDEDEYEINNIDENNDENFSDNDSIKSEDTEDELVNVKNYTKIIKSLVQYNNNVYLSATIDPVYNFEYYSKDLRTMIDLKYLCDYQIHVPIFNDDPTNKNICDYLLKNYRNIIIYCNSQKEGKLINKLMNKLQLNSSEYIDCNTLKKKRNIIIEKYKNGKIPFLINVRILVEGFDAPITKGVCFLHIPTNKTTLIQIIGRCLRLHSTKTIANIILPFSAKEDEKNICNFLKVMAKNDNRIRKSYQNKQLGGYISIVNPDTNEEEEDNDDEDDDDEYTEFKYNMIYNSLGILQNGEKIWTERLARIKKYIDENNKRPSQNDKNSDIKSNSMWISHQQNNYKKDEYNMKNPYIRKLWEEFVNDDKYSRYFISNEEQWKITLIRVKKYIDENNKRPSNSDKDVKIKSDASWINTQQINYKNNEYIMSNPNIHKLWEEFVNDIVYSKYFLSNEEQWKITLTKIKKYIDKNNKRPSQNDKNVEIKTFCKWISHQQTNYKNNKQIIRNPYIRKLWEEFVNDDKYSKYLLSNEDEWKITLTRVKIYIDENNKRPLTTDKNIEIKSDGNWINIQQQNYKKKEQIMCNTDISKLWEKFINDPKYNKYFISNEEQWKITLDRIKNYIDENNKRPSESDKNIDIKSDGSWINTQQINYKKKEQIMCNPYIRLFWEAFINDTKYSKYFISNEEEWKIRLESVKKYIDKNNKRPSQNDKNSDIKSDSMWISHQQNNYKKDEYNMKNPDIRKLWEEFVNDTRYSKYFISNEEQWKITLIRVKKYIDENNKRPSNSDKNIDIKSDGRWISTQQKNYKKNEQIMKKQELCKLWEAFVNDPKYNSYFKHIS
jgi:superfamily II DNA or RNA helicase